MAKKRRKTKEPGLLKACFQVIGFPFVAAWYMLVGIFMLLRWIIFSLFRLISGKKKLDVSQMDGYQFEEYVAARLRKQGFHHVDVTPKSGDFGADIVAKDKRGAKVCFQCKNYSKPVGPKAVQEVYAAIQHYGCEYGVVVAPAGYTESAITLARDCGVQLWEQI